MEFGEKLQELRKKKDMTQEELAEALYVSRTAISKWESGRGYPSIDSLKEISRFFSVSIDELLSAEKMVSIAEKENKENIQYICNMLLGTVDLMALALIILPIFPSLRDGFYYAVSLPYYTQTSDFNLACYWGLIVSLVLMGVAKLIMTRLRLKRGQKTVTTLSLVIGIIAVLFFAMAREAYGAVILFLLVVAKWMLIYKMR
jgi:transcriptional regulator with XRE-family HTH domain